MVLLVLSVVLVSCGGADGEAALERAAVTTDATTPPNPDTPSETTDGPVGAGQSETDESLPFVLRESLPVPPDFRAAYQRRALISVYFYGSSQDPFYPQGLGVDGDFDSSMQELRSEYPTIEFFAYDIGDPGDAGTEGAQLEPGQYGTLAAQLNVGYTPFVATMAPSGDGYVILNRFQGYTPQPVLSQALYDLSGIQVSDNTSDVDVSLDRVELTGSGGGIEYFTVTNPSDSDVDLQGFSLSILEADTGEVTADSPGVTVEDSVEVAAGESVSVGRVPDVADADGNTVAGTFGGGQEMDLQSGDQVALLDSGGAFVATSSISREP